MNEVSRVQTSGQGALCANIGTAISGLIDRTYYREGGEYVQDAAGNWGYRLGQYHPGQDEVQIARGINDLNPVRTLGERLHTARHEAAHKLGFLDEASAENIATKCAPGGPGFGDGGLGGPGNTN